MRTPITYYGGKQRLADTIIAMMPAHKIYCEPFFGGGAVFFAKPKQGIEVINDHDNRLINFYLAVQNHFPALQHMIQNTLHSEAMYYHAKNVWNERVEATEIEKAWAIWLITNGSFAGSMHGGWKWDNGSSGSHAGVSLFNKRDAFTQEISARLQHVQISSREALKVISDRDSPSTFFYLDPPYPGSVQQHYAGYTHTMLYDLLQLLGTIKGKFILSQYWSQTLRYHIIHFRWNFKTIEMTTRVNNLGQHKGKKMKTSYEILVYNFDDPKTLFD